MIKNTKIGHSPYVKNIYYHRADCGVHKVQEHCDRGITSETHIIYPRQWKHAKQKDIQELIMLSTDFLGKHRNYGNDCWWGGNDNITLHLGSYWRKF